ncbi:ribonuclease PH [Prochlorococcus sp. MIT 1307]|uniref:ribonuclease PH n=1 Tax=Prochlorococcus sp. MIT 1307 TaxID=3096219 RepID=UPI002A74EEC5|nr:ribonuclease PH [Prochlorococcus sp. MIT 1307]
MSSVPEMRATGRFSDELRHCQVTLDPMGFALSSLIIKTGHTSVLCSVSMREGVPSWLEGSGKGWLSAEYRLLPASTPTRQNRELMKLSGRTQEIQRLIGRSLRAVLNMEVLGEKTFLIDCDVIQADAGTRTASITGSWIALKLACLRLLKKGILINDPIAGQVAAVSVGLKDGTCLLDLDYNEDSSADVDMNVVMDADGRLLELQGTAEGKPFSRAELNNLLDIAEPGIKQLLAVQLSVL